MLSDRLRLLGIKTMFQGVLIAFRGAGARCAAVHAAAGLTGEGRGLTRCSLAGLGTAARACSHGSGIPLVCHRRLISPLTFGRLPLLSGGRRNALRIFDGVRLT